MSGLPQSWVECQIGEVTKVVAGGTPPSGDKDNFTKEGGIPWLTPADLSGYKKATVSRGARNLTEKGFNACSAIKMPAGSVLFSSRAPIGYVAIADNEISTNQGFKSFVPPKGLESRWLYYWLRFIKPIAEQMATGTTFKELSGSAAAKLPLSIAPLPEQTRIADKLDALLARVDAARARLDRVPALLKRFRQSVLAAATSGELTEDWRGGAEAEWEKATFGDACESSYYGPRFGKDEYTDSEDGIPTVRTTDMTDDGRIEITDDTPRVAVPACKLEKFAAKAGDLLVTRTGSIGVMAVFDGSYVAIPSAYLIRFRFKDSILPRYAFYCLMAPMGQSAMGLSTTAITQPNINAESIKAISIELPSTDEQTEIIRRVEALFALADQVQARYGAARARVDKLTPALLAKAFRGELVPQDPGDEPASVLLERLRASKASEPAAAKRGRKPSSGAAKTRSAR